MLIYQSATMPVLARHITGKCRFHIPVEKKVIINYIFHILMFLKYIYDILETYRNC